MAETPTVQTEQLNETKNFEEKLKDFKGKLISSAPLLCGAGIAIWWIFYGMVKIVPTDLSITERIGLTVCTIFLALTYCKLISVGGFTSAKETRTYQALASKWNDAIKRGNTQKAEIIEYAKDIARDNQKELRVKNLENVGLCYSEIFDEKGELIKLDYKTYKYSKKKNPNGYFKNQIKMIKHCINIRVEIPEMFGNISSKFFGVQKRKTQKEYEHKTDIKNGIVRSIVSIFSVGISFYWLGLSWSAVIYAIFQIVLWTGSGVVQRVNNYNFIVNEIQPQIVENTLIINGYMDLEEERKALYHERALEEEAKKNRKQIPTNLF